jgi:hypothetical protein
LANYWFELIHPKVPLSQWRNKAERAAAIDILPDDVLLQIFDFCRVEYRPPWPPCHFILEWRIEWRRLVQVCRRWRQLIFSSPGRLDLYLICTYGTPVRKNLDIWPAFPIAIDYVNHLFMPNRYFWPDDEDNVNTALKHPDRVRCLKVPVTSSLLENMTQPFPILTHLWLSSKNGSGSEPVLPSSFLGGSAQRLREIYLEGIIFPTLPTFLSSASDLVNLTLHGIPYGWYVSPEVMVAGLAALIRLGFLSIEFQSKFESWTSHPDQNSGRRLEVPPTRVIFPALTFFGFQGAYEYVEGLMAQIDAPRLTSIMMMYFDQHVSPLPQLSRFVSQTQIVKQALKMDAEVYFYPLSCLRFVVGHSSAENRLDLGFWCEGLASQVSYSAEVLSQLSVVLSNVHHLSLSLNRLYPGWQVDVDHMAWLALLRLFTPVETLRVVHPIARYIADALNDITTEMAPEILPALHLVHLGE